MKLQKGNVLFLDKFGILILGASGSGKSALTLSLIERGLLFGRRAFLIADDYVELEEFSGKIFACSPSQISGVMEIRGAGLFEMDFAPKTSLDLVIELNKMGERYPEKNFFKIMDIKLPMLKLPQIGMCDLLLLCHAVEAVLFKKRWNVPQKNKIHQYQ